jgi:hypothetical protein
MGRFAAVLSTVRASISPRCGCAHWCIRSANDQRGLGDIYSAVASMEFNSGMCFGSVFDNSQISFPHT